MSLFVAGTDTGVGKTHRDAALAFVGHPGCRVVAQNRLGCLNHTALTVRSIVEHGLPCAGIVLNELPRATDIATATNADILQEIMDIPRLPGLLEDMYELPPGWRRMMDSV